VYVRVKRVVKKIFCYTGVNDAARENKRELKYEYEYESETV